MLMWLSSAKRTRSPRSCCLPVGWEGWLGLLASLPNGREEEDGAGALALLSATVAVALVTRLTSALRGEGRRRG